MVGSRFRRGWTTSGWPYQKGGSPYVYRKDDAYVCIRSGQHGAVTLQVFRSENGAGISVPGTRDYGYDPSPKDYVLFVESSMPGLKGAAREELGFFINSEVHDIELRGSESRVPDPSNNNNLSLVPHKGIKSIPTVKAYGVKLLPSSRASVKGNEPGSPHPADGWIGSRFGRDMSSALASGR